MRHRAGSLVDQIPSQKRAKQAFPLLRQVLLEPCFRELKTRLRREEDELCRVALLGWMDFAARAHGGELYRQFKELLPDAPGLRRPDGSILIILQREADMQRAQALSKGVPLEVDGGKA